MGKLTWGKMFVTYGLITLGLCLLGKAAQAEDWLSMARAYSDENFEIQLDTPVTRVSTLDECQEIHRGILEGIKASTYTIVESTGWSSHITRGRVYVTITTLWSNKAITVGVCQAINTEEGT